MSASVLRDRTARNLRRARATYGDSHPATWAAYGRAIAAWGGAARIHAIAPTGPDLNRNGDLELACIAVIAHSRAITPGHINRHSRRRRAA